MMGMLPVEIDGKTVKYYSNGGAVMVDGEIIGEIDEDAAGLYKFDYNATAEEDEAERKRSQAVLVQMMRRIYEAWKST